MIGGKVGPAVADAEVTAGGLPEAARGDERVAAPAVGGHQGAALRSAGVVVAGHRKSRVMQNVHVVGVAGERVEPDVHQDGGAHGVGHVGLGDDVLAGLRAVDLPVHQALRIEQLDPVDGGGAFEIGEGAAVADDELGVSGARRVDARVVDLAQLAVAQRVPDLAPRAACGSEAVLVTGNPVTRLSRSTGRLPTGSKDR